MYFKHYFHSINRFNFIILLISFIITCPIYAQVFRYKDTFPNGQLKYKGKYRLCVTQDDYFPYIFNHEKRKIGTWIAYYPTGAIAEVRQYTKKVKDCYEAILKEGEWKYFNEEGILYRMERYSNDTLTYSEIEIYEGQSLVSKMIVTDYSRDTIFYVNKSTKNLVSNPSFDQYVHKPILIVNNGKNQIESLIPYWYSPDKATPDYYNQHRRVQGIPEHFSADLEGGHNGYIGLMLFLGEKRKVIAQNDIKNEHDYKIDYSESIQSKLVKKLIRGNNYCFKAKIILSSNAGYSIDRFGVIFSNEPIWFNHSEIPSKPNLSFLEPMSDTKNWKSLCKEFTATGEEAYITLGRFSQREETKIIPQEPNQFSELDVNRAAYYLIDDLQLYRIDSSSVCGCSSSLQEISIIKNYNNFEEINLESRLPLGSKFVLSKINFDFDRADIKDDFIPELNRLLYYLELNPSVQIIIYGHTDNEGTELYNQNLSRERARAIKEWLVKYAIDEKRIKHEGLGDSMPLLENINEENRQINRRVEFQIVQE